VNLSNTNLKLIEVLSPYLYGIHEETSGNFIGTPNCTIRFRI
jgi:hypothetical protein